MKQSLRTIALLLLVNCTVNALWAQDALYASNNNLNVPQQSVRLHNFSREAANIKISASFNRQFPTAEQVKWISGEQTSEVHFVVNGRKTKAVFTPNGCLRYALTTCTAEQLPKQLQQLIQKQYTGFVVLNAVEINAHDAVAYQVILENKTGYVTLKSTADAVEELERITKQ